jgi:hypothetical protein
MAIGRNCCADRHRLTKAATTIIAAADFPRLIEACGHALRVLDLDTTNVAT